MAETKSLSQFAERVREAVARIEGPNPVKVPGPKQCQWCRARASCRDLAAYNLRRIQEDFARDGMTHIAPVDPQPLTDDELAGLVGHVDLIKGWIDAVKKEAQTRIEAGRKLPGHKLVVSTTQRRWRDPKEAALAMLFNGLNPWNDPTVKSPAQVEKDIGAAATMELLGDMFARKPGKPTLAREADARAEWTGSKASADFATSNEGKSNE